MLHMPMAKMAPNTAFLRIITGHRFLLPQLLFLTALDEHRCDHVDRRLPPTNKQKGSHCIHSRDAQHAYDGTQIHDLNNGEHRLTG